MFQLDSILSQVENMYNLNQVELKICTTRLQVELS